MNFFHQCTDCAVRRKRRKSSSNGSNPFSKDASCNGRRSAVEFREVMDEFDKEVSLLGDDVRLLEVPDLLVKGLGGGKGAGAVLVLGNLDSERLRTRLEGLQTVFLPEEKSSKLYEW